MPGAMEARAERRAMQVAYAKNPDYDRMGWVNDVIVHMWPHIAAATGHMIREMADPLLQQNKPKYAPAHIYLQLVSYFNATVTPACMQNVMHCKMQLMLLDNDVILGACELNILDGEF